MFLRTRSQIVSFGRQAGRFPSTMRKLSTENKNSAKEEHAEPEVAAEQVPEKPTPLEEKDKQIAQLQDGYRRCLADMENLRNRTKKEVESASVYAVQKFAKELLETADTLSIALKSTPQSELTNSKPLKDLYDGIILTQNALNSCFKRFGISSFDPTGEIFNPNLHQALYKAPAPGKEPGTVLQTSQIGYMLHERVIRPAQVGVVADE